MLSVCMQFLEHYKLELARRRFGPTTGVASRAAYGSVDEPPAKKARIELDQTYSGSCAHTFTACHQFLYVLFCSMGAMPAI